MNRITKGGLILGVVCGLLFGFGANADQTFTFSDDFSSTNHLDLFNTIATIASGRVYNSPGTLNSSVVSTTIAFTNGNVATAKVDPAVYVPGGSSFVYYLSNNNGANWMQVNPGYTYSFDILGNQLIWKAVMSRQNASIDPYLDAITVTYTVGSQVVPNSNQYNSNSNYNYGNGFVGTSVPGADIWGRLCGTLASLGLGCGSGSPTGYQPGSGSIFYSAQATNDINGSSNGSSNISNSALTASLATAGGANDSDEVILVKVKNRDGIYAITAGKKRLIPTMDIFYDYGYRLEMVQEITQKELDKFPRVKLVEAKGVKKPHYLTEGGMIRVIPNDKVFDSYGDRKEDIVMISKKEFNWYPQNQFVFLENPLNRDVYQLVDSGKAKRYLTPVAVKRMKLISEQIAPINDTELSLYKTEKPIVM